MLLGLLYRRVYQRLLLPVGRGLRRGCVKGTDGPNGRTNCVHLTPSLIHTSTSITTHTHSIQRRGSGPFALLASLLMTSCLLPLLLVSLPLLLLWPLTLAIVSVRACREMAHL